MTRTKRDPGTLRSVARELRGIARALKRHVKIEMHPSFGVHVLADRYLNEAHEIEAKAKVGRKEEVMPERRIDDSTDTIRGRKACRSREHEPASHLYRPPGTYEHTCPECGEKVVFHVEGVVL